MPCIFLFSFPFDATWKKCQKTKVRSNSTRPYLKKCDSKAASCTTGFWVWCLCCSCTGTKSVRKNVRNSNYKYTVRIWDGRRLSFSEISLKYFIHLSLVNINWQVLQANCFKIRWFLFFPQTKEETHRPSAIRELFQTNKIEDFFPQPAGTLTSLEFAWLPFSYPTPVAWGANSRRVTCMAHIQPTKLTPGRICSPIDTKNLWEADSRLRELFQPGSTFCRWTAGFPAQGGPLSTLFWSPGPGGCWVWKLSSDGCKSSKKEKV